MPCFAKKIRVRVLALLAGFLCATLLAGFVSPGSVGVGGAVFSAGFAAAQEAPRIVVSNESATRGESVTLTLSLENNPGIVNLLLDLHYDAAALELTAVNARGEDGALLLGEGSPDVVWYTETPDDSADALSKNPKRLSWAADTSRENLTTSGVICSFSFRVKSDAPLGKAAIFVTYDPEDAWIYNAALQPVSFETVAGSVAVEPREDDLPGDMNGDRHLTIDDVTALLAFLSVPNGQNTVADVDRDGKVTIKDVSRLLLSLAQ